MLPDVNSRYVPIMTQMTATKNRTIAMIGFVIVSEIA